MCVRACIFSGFSVLAVHIRFFNGHSSCCLAITFRLNLDLTVVAPLYYTDILLTIFNIIEPLLLNFVKYLLKSVTMLF